MTFISRPFAAIISAACCAVPALAQDHPISIAAEYTYLHTNIAPGCSCFSVNGSSAEVLVSLAGHVDGLGTLTLAHASDLTQDGYSLTQLSYTFGARYLITHPAARTRPFAQVQLGGAHAFGSLSPARDGPWRLERLRFETGAT